MKPIPMQVAPTFLKGLELVARGKVSELYQLPDYPELLLKVISDRVSVHDIILPFHVPEKGVVLNFIDHFWRRQFPNVLHDVAAVGPKIDRYLPPHLCGNLDLHRHARVVVACAPLPVEIIYRWLLTGTGLKKYRQNGGFVCGQKLPDGLMEWDAINPPVFTPTTKDPDGHDEHMDIQAFTERFGHAPLTLTRSVFERGKDIAAGRGVAIADTKFEVGKHNGVGSLALIDEVLTPDSSRYLTPEGVFEARRTGKKPPSFDKQPIRDYVQEALGVGADTPLTGEVIAKVHGARYPKELITHTRDRYVQLLELLTGMTPDEYAATL